MSLKWAAAALMMIGTTAPIGTAARAGGSPAVASPEQAGYAVTGNRFSGAETTVRLPDAGRFAGELGQLSVSVQLWTAYLVLDLRATACTDASCKPGGSPESRMYHLQFAEYSRTTGALICSTSAAGSLRCPSVGRSWSRARFRPGSTVALSLVCPTPRTVVVADAGTVQETKHGRQQEYQFDTSNPLIFRQARIGAEFGATPWSHAAFRAPGTVTSVLTFDRQPLFAEIVGSGGSAGWIVSRRWKHEQVWMSGGRSGGGAEARPGRIISRYGYGFTVYLEP